MEHPAVSVIIPVWNSGKYFRECLDSVLSQSLRNIEVLIVDDASTDGSGAVAEEYASRDARITVMHQPSSTGAGPARNRAMAVARGEYIAFMDSDDLYPSKDVLETLYHKAVEKKANICGGSLYEIDSEKILLDKQFSNQFFIKEGWYNYNSYQYDGGFYRFLYNRVFINENKIKFPNYRRFQDPVFFVNAMIFSERFYAITMFVYAYRKDYKKVIWNCENIKDYLNGISDILLISKIKKLSILHYYMAKNLIDFLKYRIDLYRKKILIFYIIKTYNHIDWDMVYIYRRNKYVKKYKFFMRMLL